MITVYDINKSDEWDNIVKSFENYDVYYLSGYIKALESNGDGQGLLIYFDDGVNQGINVVIKRKIDDVYSDFSTPYGYGGFLITGDKKIVLNRYEEYCKQNNIVSEFVRFNPVLKNASDTAINLGKTVYIKTDTSDMITKFDPKCRTKIRKAIKNGIEVFNTTETELIDTFIDIYNGTMDKEKATSYYYFDKEYYETLFASLVGNIKMYYAVLDEKIIAMSIIMFTDEIAQYHLSCSIDEYMNLAPTNLILHSVSVDCFNQGKKLLHLGGGLGSQIDSLYKFKKGFSKDEDLEFCIGKNIYNLEVYNKLCKEMNIEDDGSFFPSYRKV